MWLTCSTVGRKFIMAVSGAVLMLFVTFHCCMNAIAICWPATYNSLCEFLGANWYALIASVFLALFILLHIVYACWLTLQNRKARGPVGYSISKKPKTVEWTSQNMLVLGIVVLGFLVVHLIQFWARMQLQEIRGVHDVLPPAAGTLFLQEAFQTNWTLIVYGVGFAALWLHLNHGIWSMFQSVGWDNRTWIPRLKKVALTWSTVVFLVFMAEGIVFTVKAHEGYFLKNETLREQYKNMLVPEFEKDFGPDAAQMGVFNMKNLSYDDYSWLVDHFSNQLQNYPESLEEVIKTPEISLSLARIQDPQDKEKFLQIINDKIEAVKRLKHTKALLDYINGVDSKQASTASLPVAPEVMETIETQEGFEMMELPESDTEMPEGNLDTPNSNN